MKRIDLINNLGAEYHTTNIENDEWSYKKKSSPLTLEKVNNYLKTIEGTEHFRLDLRFEYKNLSILIETKKSSNNREKDERQLETYFELEKIIRPYNNIIAVLLDLDNLSSLKAIKYNVKTKDKENYNGFNVNKKVYEYLTEFNNKKNNKEDVVKNTYQLNETLHKYNIKESIRAQFVGSCLVALNIEGFNLENELKRMNWSTEKLLREIAENISSKIDRNAEKEKKISILTNILKEQDLQSLEFENLKEILIFINEKIIPFINDQTNQGEDLLNLFFTTFNKYVQKEDKNQAFTPSHITDFMSEVINIDSNSVVLDPTCGSGSFLIQAMMKMLKNEKDPQKRENIKQKQIFGIEIEEKAFGLAATNMLIHKDGKSNIILGNMFDDKIIDKIKNKNISHILMNPPFNAKRMPNDAPKKKNTGMDATKGLFFVYSIAKHIKTEKALLATILPLSVAIGNDQNIQKYKKLMLEYHTLKAVFSLPNDIFHPGASASSCIMVFELNTKHNSKIPTFFGYYKEDGFIKKKNMGRIEKEEWNNTKNKWLEAYRKNTEIDGFSVLNNVDYQDEWLAEAYMKTDFSILEESDFIRTIREFLAFKIKEDIK